MAAYEASGSRVAAGCAGLAVLLALRRLAQTELGRIVTAGPDLGDIGRDGY
ncbi:hypothetical protein [Conexibacter sp. SYSU D00693]|uniref:hypothetical protein n=1 Tax=Conexibacter sp. SYSU D00693 TaxID=2812560 RepID=UPI00196B890A|nr:hypothetical protein [Conexibacter sp. SYSU D00693]